MASELQTWKENITKAYHRIKGHIKKTPLMYSAMLSKEAQGAQVYVKMGKGIITEISLIFRLRFMHILHVLCMQ